MEGKGEGKRIWKEEMGERRTGVSIAQGIPAYSSMRALRKSFKSSSM